MLWHKLLQFFEEVGMTASFVVIGLGLFVLVVAAAVLVRPDRWDSY